MGKVIGLVQARTGSTRFPGKMIAPLGGRSLIEWVLLRAKQSSLPTKIALATTDLESDDRLVEIAKSLHVPVYRGSEIDVLERLILAAESYEADTVIRICGDNPFIDPNEIDRLVNFFEKNQCDYACNHQSKLGSAYSDGFGAEILSYDLLRYLGKIATDSKHREHATSYLWDNHSKFNLKAVKPPPSLAYPELRFDVDTVGDYQYIKELVSKGVDINMSASSIVAIAKLQE